MKAAIDSFLPGIKYLILRVTNRCNATCPFCLNNYYLTTATDGTQKKLELTIDEYEKIAKSINGLVLLNLSGGEPYLREDLDEIATQFIKHSGARYISSPTNGAFPERVEQIASKLLSQHKNIVLKVNISIDGINEDHDKIRGIKNGYDKAIETAERLVHLRKTYPNLILNSATTVTRDNVYQTEEIISTLAGTKLFNETLINLVRDKDPNAELNLDEFKIYRKAIENTQLNKHDQKNMQSWMLGLIYKEIFSLTEKSYLTKKNEFDCIAGRKMLNIDERGNVAICEILENPVIGNLREHSYDINRILKLSSTQERLKLIGKRTCNCHWSCAVSGTILFSTKGKISVLNGIVADLIR